MCLLCSVILPGTWSFFLDTVENINTFRRFHRFQEGRGKSFWKLTETKKPKALCHRNLSTLRAVHKDNVSTDSESDNQFRQVAEIHVRQMRSLNCLCLYNDNCQDVKICFLGNLKDVNKSSAARKNEKTGIATCNRNKICEMVLGCSAVCSCSQQVCRRAHSVAFPAESGNEHEFQSEAASGHWLHWTSRVSFDYCILLLSSQAWDANLKPPSTFSTQIQSFWKYLKGLSWRQPWSLV